MDYYKCTNCGKVFDEFEMNYQEAQIDKKFWCSKCRLNEYETYMETQRLKVMKQAADK